MKKSFMKFHLPPILFRALAACWVGALSLAGSAAAKVMLSDTSLITYADFGQNMGRYAVGGHVNALLQAIREQEGGVRITYTNDLPDYTLEHGMIDFGSGDSIGVSALIAPSTLATVKHNGVLAPVFSPAGIRYQCVEYRYSSVFLHAASDVDFKVSRTNKLVTDTTAAPLYLSSGNANDLVGQLLYQAGSGFMHYGSAPGQTSGICNAYTYITGGITSITGSSEQGDGGTRQSINLTGTSPTEPLAFQGQGGDSGSPAYIWNEATGQYAYLNALQAIGGHETYINGNTAWAQEQVTSGYRDTLDLGNTHNLSFAATETQGASFTDTVEDIEYSGTAYRVAIEGIELSMSVLAGKTNAATRQAVYTWAALNEVRDKDDWYTYGNEYFNASDAAATPADKRSYAELFLTRDTCLRAADSETYTLSFDRMIDTGIGYTEWTAAEGQTADFVLQSADGTSGQLLTAGYVVGKDVALHLQFTNAADYLREWRKIGEGDLYIDGAGGDNHILLNIGGNGTTYLDRRDAEGNSAMAAYSVIINTGSTLVLRGGVDQVGRLVTLGSGGATLDFAGHSMEWNADAEAAASGFNIQALTEEGIITNSGAGTTTLTVTDAGATNFLGSFRDQAGAGALKIVYNADAAWTWNGIATDLSNTGSGVEVQRGTLTLTGTLTEHGAGSLHGWSADAYSHEDDWHYADARTDISITGGTFCLGSHARLIGDITVGDGATFIMNEGVRHTYEYLEGGERLDNTELFRDYYGLKGNVHLEGSNSCMQVSFSEQTDATQVYSGAISGAGSLSIDTAQGVLVLAGNNSAHTGTKELTNGTLLLVHDASIGNTDTHQWVVGAESTIATMGDAAVLLNAIDSASTGTLALAHDQEQLLDFSEHSNLVLGALRGTSVVYGNAQEQISSSLHLGGEGELQMAAQFVSGSALSVAGHVSLQHEANTISTLTLNGGSLSLLNGSSLTLTDHPTLAEGGAISVASGANLVLSGQNYGDNNQTKAEHFAAVVNAISGDGTVTLQGSDIKVQLGNSSVAPPAFRSNYVVQGNLWLQKDGAESSWIVANKASLQVSGKLQVSDKQTLCVERGGSISAGSLVLGLEENNVSYTGKLVADGASITVGALHFAGRNENNSADIRNSHLHFTNAQASDKVIDYLLGSGHVSISNSTLSSDHGFSITNWTKGIALSNSTLDAGGGDITFKGCTLAVSGALDIAGGSVALNANGAGQTSISQGRLVIEQGSSLSMGGTVSIDAADAIATGTLSGTKYGYLTEQTGWLVEKVVDNQGGTFTNSAYWKLSNGTGGTLDANGNFTAAADHAVSEGDKVFYVTAKGSVFNASDYSAATGFVVLQGGSLYLTESSAGTLSLGEALRTAKGSGSITIGNGIASAEAVTLTVGNDQSTQFRGDVYLVSNVTFNIGTTANNGRVDLSSLNGLTSYGATLTYGAGGESKLNNFRTLQYSGSTEATPTTLAISSTSASGKLIFGGTTALEQDFTITTRYEAHVEVEQLSGSARLTFCGAESTSYGSASDIRIASLENYSGTLELRRMQERAATHAELWTGAQGAQLAGISLDSGATANLYIQGDTHLGAISLNNTRGIAAGTLTLQSDGHRISADSVSGQGARLCLQGEGSLQVGQARLEAQGGGTAELGNVNTLEMTGSMLCNATLSNTKLTLSIAEQAQAYALLREATQSPGYALTHVAMDAASTLCLEEGVAVEASGSVLANVQVKAGSSLTGDSLLTGETQITLSATADSLISDGYVIVCNRLEGMMLSDGSSLTLDISAFTAQLDPQHEGLQIVFSGLSWESEQALTEISVSGSLWEIYGVETDGTNTLVYLGAQVPEPATTTLGLLALAALAARRRR